jgi:uncharacterized protein YecE (DUF72 family)
MAQTPTLHIGTSGWNYPHWYETFYPPKEDLQQDLLVYYAEHFQTVEINNSFYQLPTVKTFRAWRDSTPAGFVFAVKASRYLTHLKKLKEVQESALTFLKRAETLGDKLGPILFQLPPRWHVNRERLAAFLQGLPAGFRYTFEFRDRTWLNPDIYALLADFGCALCIYDLKGQLSPKEVTADFVYVRLHGPHEQAYTGSYDTAALAGWAGAFSTWLQQGKEVFCYFDNDEQGFAPHNALELQQMVK